MAPGEVCKGVFDKNGSFARFVAHTAAATSVGDSHPGLSATINIFPPKNWLMFSRFFDWLPVKLGSLSYLVVNNGAIN